MRSAVYGWLVVTTIALAACGSEKQGSTCASGAACSDGGAGAADAGADVAPEASPPAPVNACAGNPEGPTAACNDLTTHGAPIDATTFDAGVQNHGPGGGTIVPGAYVLVAVDTSSTLGFPPTPPATLLVSDGCLQAAGLDAEPSSYTWTAGPSSTGPDLGGTLTLTRTCPSPGTATANYAATATTLELSFQTGTIVPVTPTYVFQLQ
ncbi:MAG TPA: hypothetical protein VIF09_04920 [Polyangiaceae bacterium]